MGLKDAVRSLIEVSKAEIFDSLMRDTPLVGKPSVWIRNLQNQVEGLNISEDMLRHKVLQSLPQTIRIAIASTPDLSLTQIGKLTDELIAYGKSDASINAVEQDRSRPRGRNDRDHRDRRQENRSASPAGRATYSSLRPFHEDQRPRVCRAHVWFGNRAKTCTHFCEWPNKNGLTVRERSSSRPGDSVPR
jgi:hypothetical protein